MTQKMLQRVRMMLLTMPVIFADPVTRHRTVSVTGFDNYSNRSIAREVQIPVENSLDQRTVESTVRLCRHAQLPGGQKVSKCWPGVGCEAATGEKHFSYLLFLDTCEDEHAHSRYCSTQFVRNCPYLGMEEGVGNMGKDLIEDQNKAVTTPIKLPRIVKKSHENINNIGKPVKRLTLGLKSNTLDRRRSEDQIQDGDLKIVRKDINPNIIVNYLNKKQNRKYNTGEVEPKKQLLLEDIHSSSSDLVLYHTKDDVTTEKQDMIKSDTRNYSENLSDLEGTTLGFEENELTTLVDEVSKKPIISEISTSENIVIKETVTEQNSIEIWTLMESEEQFEQHDREKIVQGKITTDRNFGKAGFNTIEEQSTNTPTTIEWKDAVNLIDEEQYTTENINKEIPTTRLNQIKVENIIITNHTIEITEKNSNHEINRVESIEDFQFPEDIIGTIGKIEENNISSGEEGDEVIKELNKFVENNMKVEETSELNINYILDVLKDIKIPGEESSNDLKDITDQYNVRKMIEDGIGKDEDDRIDFGEESELNEYLQGDVEYQDNKDANKEQILVEEESSTNDNTDEENTTVDTTVDMYAGDVDIIFGL